MKVLIFGATGMVGQGVLRECLLAQDVEQVQTVGRTSLGDAGKNKQKSCMTWSTPTFLTTPPQSPHWLVLTPASSVWGCRLLVWQKRNTPI